MGSVKVTITYYSASGQVAGTNYSYAMYDYIASGQRSPFRIIANPSSDWTRYELNVTWGNPYSWLTYNHDFAIINTNGYWQGSLYYVVGEVQNNTSQTWRYVQPIITLYNAPGQVIDADFTYVSSTDLAPGQKSSFSELFSGSHLSALSRYEIGAEGWR